MSALLAAWAGAVGAYDGVTRRVPNLALVLVLVPALLALAVNGEGLLGAPPLSSLLGLIVAAALFLPGYRRGQTGAGDVKFAACIGLLLGFKQGLEFALLALVAMGLCSLAALVWRRVQGQGRDLQRRIPAGAALAVAFWIELSQGPVLHVFGK